MIQSSGRLFTWKYSIVKLFSASRCSIELDLYAVLNIISIASLMRCICLYSTCSPDHPIGTPSSSRIYANLSEENQLTNLVASCCQDSHRHNVVCPCACRPLRLLAEKWVSLTSGDQHRTAARAKISHATNVTMSSCRMRLAMGAGETCRRPS